MPDAKQFFACGTCIGRNTMDLPEDKKYYQMQHLNAVEIVDAGKQKIQRT